MITSTYGVMPSREAFELAFQRECPNGSREFGNDKRVGSCSLSCDELFAELEKAHEEWEGTLDGNNEASGDWCSSILESFGFEWV